MSDKLSAKLGRCPICRSPSAPDYRPFCSRGCRDRDLLSWLGEEYRVPVRGVEVDAGEAEGPPREPDED